MRERTYARRKGDGQRGVILIEGLVAILIFSIGILGLVALQTVSVKSATEAQFRSEAAFHVNSVVAEMRLADPMQLSTLYGTQSGSGYTAWKARIVAAGTGLPGANETGKEPTIDWDAPTRTATITVRWKAQNEDGFRRHVVVTHFD